MDENTKIEVVSFPLKDDIQRHVYLRAGTSDIKNFEQVILNKEYEPVFKYMKRKPKVILDLGAYVGLSMIYFKMLAPDAKVVCVEPERGNFEMLKINAAYYDDVYLCHAAAWHKEARLSIYEQFDGYWGTRIKEDKRGTIAGWTIPDIMDAFDIEHIDLLKMDVEMSEKNIFENAGGWVNAVDCFAVELHDRYLPGCRAAFESVIHKPDFEIRQEGEITIAVRQ